jgi:hypothetical protein
MPFRFSVTSKFVKFGRPLLHALQIIDAPEGGGWSNEARKS